LRDNVATEEGDLDIIRKMVLGRVVIFCFANQNNGVFYYRWILEFPDIFLGQLISDPTLPFQKFQSAN